MRIKHTFRLPPDLSMRLADYAAQKRVSQAQIAEAALASFLSPDGSDRLEAAISRRLDRLSRQADRLENHIQISNEAVALGRAKVACKLAVRQISMPIRSARENTRLRYSLSFCASLGSAQILVASRLFVSLVLVPKR